jgi:O-antigen ligase
MNIFTSRKSKMKKLIHNMPHQAIALFACFMVILGLFWARAIFATGIIVLLGNALVNKDVLVHVRALSKHKVFLSILALFVVYAVSGLWSKDLGIYAKSMQLHLPLLAIPIGIFSFKYLDAKQLQYIFYTYILFCFGGVVWSCVKYFGNKAKFDNDYVFSHVIPTPFGQDHIRFSIAIVMAIWFCYFCIQHTSFTVIKYATSILLLAFVAYLHILSVKTGLLAFYILCLYAIVHQIIVRRQFIMGILGLALLVLLPIIAYKTSATFYNKMHYFQYSLVEMKNTKTDLAISDKGRLFSYNIAKNVIAEHPILGVGAGGVDYYLQQQFIQLLPNTIPIKTFLPHNQLLMMLLVAGVFGGVVYLFFLWIPFAMHYRHSALFVGYWLILFIPQMVEPMLETQYGITIHLFFYAIIVRYLDFENNNKKSLTL